jgi:hypothetical protein
VGRCVRSQNIQTEWANEENSKILHPVGLPVQNFHNLQGIFKEELKCSLTIVIIF